MLIPLAFIAFWPSPVDQPIQGDLGRVLRYLHAHGVPRWFDYKFIEAAANVALFVPLGIVASRAFPDKSWWRVGALGLLVSGCMELGQLLFLDDRFATPQDVVTNTAGAVIGAIVARIVTRQMRARRFISDGPVRTRNSSC
ncbi:VanZ family protein [Arthrobacter sp. BE255]|uniref:VanZ family protein n=1 Tax=Arthrobacter sp. BE255 TaxID=2817721 RepID=UPI00286A7F14|nr:VanZ family protein [Arthrobacter sp. BE255]